MTAQSALGRSYRRYLVLGAGVLVVVVLVIVVLPELLANGDPQRLKAENDIRSTLLQGLAGAFLLVGLVFTARTVQLNRQGQITERYTRAIDQLGHGSVDVRSGGVYALERLAKDLQPDGETASRRSRRLHSRTLNTGQKHVVSWPREGTA